MVKKEILSVFSPIRATLDTLRDLCKTLPFVIPAKAGIHNELNILDSRLHGNDHLDYLWQNSKIPLPRGCGILQIFGLYVEVKKEFMWMGPQFNRIYFVLSFVFNPRINNILCKNITF